jgi:hypothetical protein
MPNSAPAADKGAEAAVQALAKWMLSAQSDEPGSPKVQAITHLIQAVAEIGGGVPSEDPAAMGMGEPPMPEEGGMPMSPDMAPPDDMGMSPEDAQLAEQAGPPPTSIADAAGQTQNMMLEAAKRKQQGV